MHDGGTATEFANLFGNELKLVNAACGECNVRAAFGECEGSRAPDSAAGAGYEGNFVINSEAIKNRHL